MADESKVPDMRPQAELRLPPELTTPAFARAAVAAMSSGLPEEVVSDVELLTTELVTNALKHATASQSEQIIVRLVLHDRVRVEVIDSGPSFDPRPVRPDPGSTTGWGLFLVDTLATSWGVELEGRGKKIWFEVGP
ncbi:MAG TPA: ATP-binding protein [Actinomycetota bacterium]|nr:ATP-binding protein [Actinomycetota bacterium]